MTATVQNGEFLKLDRPLSLPDQTRVRVTVETIQKAEVPVAAAWASIIRRLNERPLHFGGRRFSRDELHERR